MECGVCMRKIPGGGVVMGGGGWGWGVGEEGWRRVVIGGGGGEERTVVHFLGAWVQIKPCSLETVSNGVITVHAILTISPSLATSKCTLKDGSLT